MLKASAAQYRVDLFDCKDLGGHLPSVRTPPSEVSTAVATHSRLKSSTTHRIRQPRLAWLTMTFDRRGLEQAAHHAYSILSVEHSTEYD